MPELDLHDDLHDRGLAVDLATLRARAAVRACRPPRRPRQPAGHLEGSASSGMTALLTVGV